MHEDTATPKGDLKAVVIRNDGTKTPVEIIPIKSEEENEQSE